MATLKQQYKKQVDRIRKALKAASKQGYVFDKDLKEIVKKPQRITEGTIRRLKKITAPKLRESYSVDRIEPSRAADGAEVIIENFVNHIGQWVIYRTRSRIRDYTMRDYALKYLGMAISQFGKRKVAAGLNRAAEQGLWFSTEEVYKMGVDNAMVMIGNMINAPQDEIDRLTQEHEETSEGEYFDLNEYTKDNTYYEDLYNF